jgi:DNA ligase (NAD+)
VKLRGVTVNYASGKNAGFIKSNRVGPGAVVRIRRAGDVIPDLADGDVIKGATPNWPDKRKFGDWEWTDSGVQIKLKSASSHRHNPTVLAKVIEHFFTTIGVEGFRRSTIEKFVDAGHTSVRRILALSERQFTQIEGTNKTIQRVYQDIQDCIEGVELPVLMDASNIFGRGMGTTRLRVIVKAYPRIMSMANKDTDYLTDLVDELPGFDETTSRQFASNLKRFAKWVASCPSIEWELPKAKKIKSAKMAGVSVIMTGFRDAELSDQIEANGGQMVSTVRRATHLLTKDPASTSSKASQARQMGIKIMTADAFKRFFRL